MATTATQKFAALCMPAAAFGLALLTSDPGWYPRREHYGSWKETLDRAAAEKAAAAAPKVPEKAPDPAATPEKAPAPGTPEVKPGEKKAPATPAPGGKKDPAPETPKPALPVADGIEYKLSGLPTSRNGGALKNPQAERLDITVAISGAYKIGINFAGPDDMKAAIAAAPDAQKKDGLLYVIPNLRTPWEAMKDPLNAGAGAGWNHIAIAVAHPDNAGLGRVLAIRIPSGPQELPKGMDAVAVVVGAGASPTFWLNGEECKDAFILEVKARALHEECELMSEGYTTSPESTAWTVDGTKAMVGGVISALDALTAAGVKTARITGVQKPAAEVKPPEEPVKDPAPEPAKDPVPEEEKK